jgi:release factor glutamine methyltransferase
MGTIKNIFIKFKEDLTNVYEAEEIEALTLLVISEVTGLSKAKIKAFPEKELTTQQTEELEKILNRLQTGEPVQYIFGHTEFYGLPLKLNPSVLIPRPETEELVKWLLTSVNDDKLDVSNILDIGTGSGCIAIALKKNLPRVNVLATDVSTEALETATPNADMNKVDIKFIAADILSSEVEIPGIGSSKFDIIVSNPPYVTQHDKTLMHQNVVDFEPHTALFAPENDPLVFYDAIADFAKKALSTKGLLFLEINENLGNETVELLKDKGFKKVVLTKDMSGRDRMIRTGI